MEDPIDVRSLTVEADDLATAIEAAGGPDEITGYGESGNIIVVGDNDTDNWATVVDRNAENAYESFLSDTIDDLKARGYFTPDDALVFIDKEDEEVWLDPDVDYEIENNQDVRYGPLKVGFERDDLIDGTPNHGHAPAAESDLDTSASRWFETVERREV